MAEDRKRRNPESDRQFPLHTDVRIKGMDRVTAQLRACVETSSLSYFNIDVYDSEVIVHIYLEMPP